MKGCCCCWHTNGYVITITCNRCHTSCVGRHRSDLVVWRNTHPCTPPPHLTVVAS